MSFAAYASIRDESPLAARETERDAFSRAIGMLETAAARPDRLALARAATFVRRLWAELMRDLAADDNELAPAVRAALISIGAWMLKEADKAAGGDGRGVAEMITIHRIVGAGLK